MASTTVPFPFPTDDLDASSSTVDSNAGAAGDSPGAYQLNHGAMIAIIVVVSFVAVLGISMAALFYVAKKREWKIREGLRRSAKKVVTALTPRRSEFPKNVKGSSARASRGRVRLDDVPPTPRLRPEDLEKGQVKPVAVRQSPQGRSSKKNNWPMK